MSDLKFRCARKPSGFTLVELLVVIALIAILAAIIFPVFSQAKEAGKRSSCLSNVKETGMAVQLYNSDYDNTYSQTRKSSKDPAIDDADGSLEEPDFGSFFNRLTPYKVTGDMLGKCPSDPDPLGRDCDTPAPDHPDLLSYLVNGYFVFGLAESAVDKPAETILLAERRSQGTATADPFCNYLYRPWFNPGNPAAPANDMDARNGAIATKRHVRANYGFADTHVKALSFDQTFQVSGSPNLHRP
ncbi:MAG: prepilin-type N-terminal cleavage/methylation domain-containing protein [Armatimonadetes bacterium]|nr:prepilin-type N-terminal cleavage/methylation domain-containing protein [Armatimonadota bacterium]MBS1711135.1 prepilin-type N-terminal cleavage/methylation domain-containing protein [Armatimonadota bacterium]MBX3108808.1 prepilin-type N-terminal cleavage/methylation domain-containing protein [Fimbriimonadaceae bacterium]